MSPQRNRDAGFTLVELLVSLAVLGLLAVLLSSGLRFGARAWERSEAHTEGMDEVMRVRALLRHEIEQAYPEYVTSDRKHPHVAFIGTGATMTFLAPAPQASGIEGLAEVTLSGVQKQSHVGLTMAIRPDGSAEGIAGELLLNDLAFLRFGYFGSDEAGGPAAWHDEWTNRKTLPLLVKISAKFPQGDARSWPTLVVAPRILVDTACIYDQVTKKCRGRR
jgi:general secretion pathway protein J